MKWENKMLFTWQNWKGNDKAKNLHMPKNNENVLV